MKDITIGVPANRTEVIYEVQFTAVELDLLYELTRETRNNIMAIQENSEPGSWTDSVIQLDKKLTSMFHKRHCSC